LVCASPNSNESIHNNRNINSTLIILKSYYFQWCLLYIWSNVEQLWNLETFLSYISFRRFRSEIFIKIIYGLPCIFVCLKRCILKKTASRLFDAFNLCILGCCTIFKPLWYLFFSRPCSICLDICLVKEKTISNYQVSLWY